MKRTYFGGSVIVTTIVFGMAFINLKDDTLFALVFVITQLFAGIVAILLILLRLIHILKNSSSFIYSLTGTFQLALVITDILLLFDHSMARRAILAFLGLNAVLVLCLLTDMGMRRRRRE